MREVLKRMCAGRGRLVAVAAILAAARVAGARAESPYAAWPNGPSEAPGFFPVAVWWQNPANGWGIAPGYRDAAHAAAAAGINTFLGLGGWPERYGADDGEIEAAAAAGTYVIGGIDTPWQEDTSAGSVASMLALAASAGASGTLIGYNMGDEPDCAGDNGQPAMAQLPSDLARLQSYDPTRIVTFNQTFWPMQPYWSGGACGSESIAALKAIGVASFDYYPLTNPNLVHYGYSYPGILPSPYYGAPSDFVSTHNDSLWVQGVATQAIAHVARQGQPVWVFVEAGGDNLGLADSYDNLQVSMAAGSDVVAIANGWSRFTPTWLGLGLSGTGLPEGARVVSIIDATHAHMGVAAAATGQATASVTGGVGNADCVAAANLCVVNGNEYRPTAPEVFAEAWLSILSGANGVEWFCHDLSSDSFCLGDPGAGPAAAEAFANLSYVDSEIRRAAPVLNAPTVGGCSMQQMDWESGALSTAKSCSAGILSVSTSDPSVPGVALAKRLGGTTYVFAMSDRRSPAGATFTFRLQGLAGRVATVLYDSNERYDPGRNGEGGSATLDGDGAATDVLGAHGDHYQLKVYAIR
jgi:hypothetical protein